VGIRVNPNPTTKENDKNRNVRKFKYVGATLIKNAQLVNEGRIVTSDVLIEGSMIKKIGSNIKPEKNFSVVDASGLHLFPGMIDTQVHFREPGLTHKACIASESKAAVAGGITSFMEMPNTIPQTTTPEEWERKMSIAEKDSYANYSFMFGGTNENLSEIKNLDFKKIPALKLFLGSSTGNMLVDDPEVLQKIFEATPLRIALHCEDEHTIQQNLAHARQQYGTDIPISEHPIIRSEEACYRSSSSAVALAKSTGARIHVFHLSTAKELSLFENKVPPEEKQITAEACIHHLWFSDQEYEEKGTLIKWNPAIKKVTDREALWEAVNDGRIDIIATDHAPHTLSEKQNPYEQAPSGGPLVQHALPALLTAHKKGKIKLERIVEKTAHNPATLFDIKDRGFLREGYFADLVLVNLNRPFIVKKEELLYRCGWSPFEGTRFESSVITTFVNGKKVFDGTAVMEEKHAMPLAYNRF